MNKLFVFYILCTLGGVVPRLLGSQGVTSGGEDSALHAAGSSPALFFFNAVAVGLTAVLSFRVMREIFALLRRAKAISVLYVLVLLSPLWATTWTTSFRQGIYAAVYLISAIYCAVSMEPDVVYETVANSATALAVLSIYAQNFFPPSGDLAPGWNGAFFQKNVLGMMMALGILAQFVLVKRWTFWRVASCVLCGALLLLSQSVTSLACLVVAVGWLSFVRMGRSWKLGLLASLFFVAVVVAVLVPNAISLLFEANGRDFTFTGRTAVWAFALQNIWARPFLGYGYFDFWSEFGATTSLLIGFGAVNAENAYLQIALFLGIPGVLASLAFTVHSWRLSARLRPRFDGSLGRALLALNVFLLVRSLTEPVFAEQEPLWFVMMVVYFMCLMRDVPAVEAPAGGMSPMSRG